MGFRDDVRDFFDKFKGYEAYYRGPWKYYRRRCAHILMRGYDTSDRIKVLDLGCGRMSSLPLLISDKRVAEYHCVDSSFDSLEVLRSSLQGLRKVKVFHSDIMEFAALCSKKYDVIVLFGVIMYLSRSQVLSLFHSLNGILRNGGVILIHEPNERGRKGLDQYGVPLSSQFLQRISKTIEGGHIKNLESYNILKVRRWVSLLLRMVTKLPEKFGINISNLPTVYVVEDLAWLVETRLETVLCKTRLGCDWVILLEKESR